jgi:hypothetical protein
MTKPILLLVLITGLAFDSSGQKKGFMASAGLHTPAFVPGDAELIINDSTSASLSVLDDPDIFVSFDYCHQIKNSFSVYGQTNFFLFNPVVDINMGTKLSTGSGPVYVNETWGVSYSFLRVNLFLGGVYSFSKHLEAFGGVGLAFNVTTGTPFIGNNPGRFTEIANSLTDVYKGTNTQYQLGGRGYWRRFSFTLQYQQSIASETEPFMYRGRSYALPGRLQSWMASIGYRLIGSD